MTILIVSPSATERHMHFIVQINSSLGTDYSKSNLLENILDPDIHFLVIRDKQSIGIEETKNFLKKLQKKPFKRKKQIGIIPDAHLLTIEAQNSLLKELEDHSESTVFILGTEDDQKVLQTIRSRSTTSFHFSEKDRSTEDFKTLLELFISNDELKLYTVIQDFEWTRRNALEFLQHLHRQQDWTGKQLQAIQKAGEMVLANVPGKQAHWLLYLTLKESRLP